MKFAAVLETGGEAKTAVQNGLVRVNGQVCTMRGKKLYPGDTVDYGGYSLRVERG